MSQQKEKKKINGNENGKYPGSKIKSDQKLGERLGSKLRDNFKIHV